VDVLDDLPGLVPGRAAGAVGDRDEVRLERLQLDERLLERALGLLGARRTELERERAAVGEEIADLRHARRVPSLG
jgi:hypothetical protein